MPGSEPFRMIRDNEIVFIYFSPSVPGDEGESEEEAEEAEDRAVSEGKIASEEPDEENPQESVAAKIKQMAQQQQQAGGAILAQR